MEKSERLSDTKLLEKKWKTIDWKQAENYVNRLQVRIAKATQEKKWNKVKRLQYLLTHSYYAKLLAVRKVTANKGKNTSGVDKELWSTPASKMKAVLSLTDKNYKAKPLRRVYIDKKGKKAKRPLGCMTEQCRHYMHQYLNLLRKLRLIQNHSVFDREDAVKTLVNTYLRHYQESIVPNGCLREI